MEDEETPPRRLTRAETKARTRALLLDAAAKVFARKGFAGASVEDIAASAGFSIGALYSNFAGKEELFVELLSQRTGGRLAEVIEIVSDHHRDLDQVRSGLSRELVEVADEDADLAPLQAEFWLYAIRNPEFLAQLSAQFRGNRDSLASVLAERAKERGQREDVAFDEVATVVLALFQGLVQLRRTDPELVAESLYGQAASWLVSGINAAKDKRA